MDSTRLVILLWCFIQIRPPEPVQGNKPVFEVASVKPNNTGEMRSNIGIRVGGRLIATNATLKNLITTAYQVKDFQISGGPGWIDTDRFDINAVASENVAPEQTLLMLRSLLEDRFKLKIHHLPKDSDVFVLRVGKDGFRMQAAQNAGDKHGVQMEQRRVYSNPTATVASFASTLENVVNRPVIDKTDLSGFYSFDLRWGRTASGEDGPSFFTAIQEQLGLRLESEKQPVDGLVIDSAEKPTAN
jgi:uncharacterized protein (TIGR03435 family)